MQTQQVREGAHVFICGFEFIASNVREVMLPNGPAVRFTGTCSDDSRNDAIRHTGYNGGEYGGNRLAGYSW